MSSKSMRRSPFVRSYASNVRCMRSAGSGGVRPPPRSPRGSRPGSPCGSSPTRSLRRARVSAGTGTRRAARSRSGSSSCDLAFRISGRSRPVYLGHSVPSWRSAEAWNVRASTPSTPRRASRRFSSPAAFSVNVTASTAARLERPRPHLMRDAMRDRRRLARAGPGEDRDRPSRGLHGLPLCFVQPRERVEPRCHEADATSAVGRQHRGNRFQARGSPADRNPMALVEDRPPADVSGRVPLHYAALFGDLHRARDLVDWRWRHPHRRPRRADAVALRGARMLRGGGRAVVVERRRGRRRGRGRQHAVVVRDPAHARRRADRAAAARSRSRPAPREPGRAHPSHLAEALGGVALSLRNAS